MTRKRATQREVLTVTTQKVDYTASSLKELKRFANALAYVRGVVHDMKLASQLATSADAIVTISDSLPRITGNKAFDGPCAFNAVMLGYPIGIRRRPSQGSVPFLAAPAPA